ncbi:uncharacterized protein LOC111034288 [Myzus persicae]|uniref:uncharacterized protein LOC111034288 n=1 Tax=Myzus persicae TaxID=13164 RepID=UPI000B9328B2|nr:uncharacterized protein LOC111034288 [Myzus persicae]XP_022171121.1 uncharacterized protein LOC111034288 [Myzus persicae]
MGKVRRYKKKLAKAAEGSTNVDGGNEEQSQQTNYLELAEELMQMKRDDDKMSVCSVMKSVKSCGGGESLKLKKDAKRYLKHAFLIKKLGVAQEKLKKRKKKSNKNDESDDDDDNHGDVEMSNQKVLDWPVGRTNNGDKQIAPVKKHRKGCQKKQNAQLAKDLTLFSKKIKKQLKHPEQNVFKT